MSVLLDKILDNENIYKAIDNVSRNKGTCGIDGMKVDELHQYMGVHLEEIKSKMDYLPIRLMLKQRQLRHFCAFIAVLHFRRDVFC